MVRLALTVPRSACARMVPSALRLMALVNAILDGLVYTVTADAQMATSEEIVKISVNVRFMQFVTGSMALAAVLANTKGHTVTKVSIGSEYWK